MGKKGARRIKLSKNLVPFVSRVVRDGDIQKKFAAAVKPINDCVYNKLHGQKDVFTGKEVHDIVKKCQRENWKGGKGSLGGKA